MQKRFLYYLVFGYLLSFSLISELDRQVWNDKVEQQKAEHPDWFLDGSPDKFYRDFFTESDFSLKVFLVPQPILFVNSILLIFTTLFLSGKKPFILTTAISFAANLIYLKPWERFLRVLAIETLISIVLFNLTVYLIIVNQNRKLIFITSFFSIIVIGSVIRFKTYFMYADTVTETVIIRDVFTIAIAICYSLFCNWMSSRHSINVSQT